MKFNTEQFISNLKNLLSDVSTHPIDKLRALESYINQADKQYKEIEYTNKNRLSEDKI